MDATTPDDAAVAAHSAAQTHHYVMHYPAHPARTSDPHYRDFDAYQRRTRTTARCYVGEHIGDYAGCYDAQGHPCAIDATGEQSGLELHHVHIEFALQNGIDLTALERDYPGVSNADAVGAWVESAANLRYLCAFHHRGPGGAHTAAHSDFEGELYIHGLITSTTNG